MVEGEMKEISEESNLNDPYVYKVPIEDERLCKSCRNAYLNKDGSPKIFRLSELEANGSNIGLKPNEWKPTLGQLHLNCRCILQYVNVLKGTTLNDYIWSEKSQRYILNEELIKDKKVERKSKVKITVGKKTFEV
jgi:hypothetical protein